MQKNGPKLLLLGVYCQKTQGSRRLLPVGLASLLIFKEKKLDKSFASLVRLTFTRHASAEGVEKQKPDSEKLIANNQAGRVEPAAYGESS